ncbi:MAG: hypothetical protein JWM47_4451 [Acidimicrobiales bacterium]|nr:hypothetical protein [Acidimicrobiales bacterium]
MRKRSGPTEGGGHSAVSYIARSIRRLQDDDDYDDEERRGEERRGEERRGEKRRRG